MKHLFLLLTLVILLVSCGSEDDGNNDKVKAFCKCATGDMEFKSSDECKEIAAEMKEKLNAKDPAVKEEALQEYKEMWAMCK